MQSVLMHPGGVAVGTDSPETRGHLAVAPGDVESVISPSQSLSSIERLEIYARAYYARLLECLRAEFPILAKAMGEDLFDQFTVDYLQRYPSHSYTLGELGRRFAGFLAETRPVAEHPNQPDWCDLLIDLARLEWTFNEVFDGPGIENQPPLDPSELQAIPQDRWAEIRLIPAPCLRLVQFRYPVGHYYRALRDGDEAAPPAAETTFLAVTRRDFICRHYELTRDEYDLLSVLTRGETLEQAIASLVANSDPPDTERLANRIHDWFRRWTREGFFLKAETCRTPTEQ
jgi:hypothetical protein